MKTQKQRYLQGKTDYGKRLKLLKSGTPRVIFRKTNRYIIAEYITSIHAQDKVEITIISKSLLKYGWPEESRGSLKSISASYLTGFLIGKKILKLKNKTPILDIGMIRNLHKSRVYAFAKGLVDAGVKMKVDEKVFPEEDRIQGKHMKNKIQVQTIKSKIEKE